MAFIFMSPGAAYAADGGASTTTQTDAVHDGDQQEISLPASPALKWLQTFGLGPTVAAEVSSIAIADDRVFVTLGSDGAGNYGARLYALDASDGQILWGPVQLMNKYYFAAGLAYENGRVFTFNSSGDLASFDAATGVNLWTAHQLADVADAAPVALDGIVYVEGTSLYAFDEQTGKQLWSAATEGAGSDPPVVTATDVYVADACSDVFDFDARTGALKWQTTPDCSGGGGSMMSLHQGKLYDPNTGEHPIVIDAQTGAIISEDAPFNTPAFAANEEFYTSYPNLVARDLTSGKVLWSDAGPFGSAYPVIVGSTAYDIVSATSVEGINSATGGVSWSAQVPPGQYGFTGQIAAGDDVLALGTGGGLAAYGSSDPTDPPSPTVPASALPEAPTALALPGAGFGALILGWAFGRRRRRQAR